MLDVSIDLTGTDGLRIWPADLWRYGKTPYNQSLYRIAWAPSRKYCGRDYSGRFVSLSCYPSAGDCWVLEKWVSPWDFARCGPDDWAKQHAGLGLYPARGEYVYKAELSCSPDQANIDKLIHWVEAGDRRSKFENRDSIRESYKAETASARSNVRDAIGDALPAFGIRPFSGGRVSRGSKTVPIRNTANQIGTSSFANTRPAKPQGVTLETR